MEIEKFSNGFVVLSVAQLRSMLSMAENISTIRNKGFVEEHNCVVFEGECFLVEYNNGKEEMLMSLTGVAQ